jgi:hypothetical protein
LRKELSFGFFCLFDACKTRDQIIIGFLSNKLFSYLLFMSLDCLEHGISTILNSKFNLVITLNEF